MAWNPIKWLYRPPATLPPVPVESIASISTAETSPSLNPAAANSRAARLIARLEQLTETARYLEKILVERTGSLGVIPDYNTDPELAIALMRIYGTDEPPAAISVEMYNYLLDAEAGITRAEIAIAETDAAMHVDPVQRLDLQRVTSVFEDALIEDGGIEANLPLLLRPLKGDRIIFDHIREAVGEYPVLTASSPGTGFQLPTGSKPEISMVVTPVRLPGAGGRAKPESTSGPGGSTVVTSGGAEGRYNRDLTGRGSGSESAPGSAPGYGLEPGSPPADVPVSPGALGQDAESSQYIAIEGFQSGDSGPAADVSVDAPADPETGEALAYELPVASSEGASWIPDGLGPEEISALVQRLAEEPVETASQGDVAEDTTANLEDRMNVWEDYYRETYELASRVDSLYQDISQFAESYFYAPLRQLDYVLKVLAGLKLLFHKPKLKDLRAGFVNFILPRLLAELAKFFLMMNINVDTIIAPVQRLLRSLGRLFGEIQKVGTDMAYMAAGGGLTGMIRSHISGTYKMPEPKRVAALDAIPAALAKLGGTLAWGLKEMAAKEIYIEQTLFRCLDSKLAGDGDRLEVLQALSSLDALINITKGYMAAGINAGSMPGSNLGMGPISQAQHNVDQWLDQNVPQLPTLSAPTDTVNQVIRRSETRAASGVPRAMTEA